MQGGRLEQSEGCGSASFGLSSSPCGSQRSRAEWWSSLGRLAPPAVPGLDRRKSGGGRFAVNPVYMQPAPVQA